MTEGTGGTADARGTADAEGTAVCAADEIAPGQAREFDVGEWRVLVCNVGGELFAVEDVCPHDRGPLGEGRLRGPTIECPRHGARFDVRDGSVLRMPAAYPVRTFPVSEHEGQLYVEVES